MTPTSEDVWTQLTRQLFPSPSANKPRKTSEQSSETKGDDAKDEGTPEGEATSDISRAMTAQAVESFALCVGMPGSGKSSLLNVYLNPNNDGIPKPTVALEYMFARRASAANAPKDVAHIWELGGGSHVSDLVKVPITSERFHNALYVIVLDLSKPSSVIPHLLHWTAQIKACVKVCVRELGKRDQSFADALKKKTYAKLGRDHPDLRAVRPCPVPLVVVGNKYDIFKNQESGRRRVLAQALRFIAHINGASLLFCSSKEKNLKDILRSTLNTHLFRSASRRLCETSPEKPLVVPAGNDSLGAILKALPPGTRREDFLSSNGIAEGAMDTWKRAVEDVFGAADLGDELPIDEPLDNDCGGDGSSRRRENESGDKNPCPEPTVDEHRTQRDEALRRYRKDAERKAKLARKVVDPAGTVRNTTTTTFTAARGGPPPLRRSSKSSAESKEPTAAPSSLSLRK